MIKKILIIALLVMTVLALLIPVLAKAQGELAVMKETATVNFPMSLDFSISASSNVSITDIRLDYTIDRDSFARVTSESVMEFTPSSSVTVSWSLDMRLIGGLPPGSVVHYWWALTDAAGKKLTTQTVTVNFDDGRHTWQTLTQGDVTLYRYNGNQAFADSLMQASQQALVKLQQDTGAHLARPVKIYIYATVQDLQGALIFPQEWTGGVTYAQYSIVAIGIAPSNLAWGERAIAHELTHVVTHQMTFGPYTRLPTWLDEGLATYGEGPIDPGYTAQIQGAVSNNSLISVRSLCSPFSAYPAQATLAYAESRSIVAYLITTYGESKMLQLLNTFKAGATYDDALKQVYGFDIAGLDKAWRQYVYQQYGKTPPAVSLSLEELLADLLAPVPAGA